ncbi:MAG TPA: bifunctional UDP-sugar hydrolase/5'-nucleotidase [Candidatus Ozemobacteraceae bacterium]|nr:bifunctional UDP-sugar hydrolase/5'-nucleotidase [Candidatus Ozemobacteraceae bacterium]
MIRSLKRLAALFLLSFSTQAVGAEQLLLLHTNDWHGSIRPTSALWMTKENPPMLGGPQALVGAFQQYKLRAVRQGIRWLQLDSGDRFQGTMEANFSRGQAMTDLFNALSYTAATIGNHDLDYGREALNESVRSSRFPIVCANLTGPGVPWRRSLVTRIGSLTIGITGVMTSELPTLTYPEHIADLVLEPPASAARRVAAELRERGCDLVILLSHCGHDTDLEIARAVPDLDVIIGGHTDHQLTQPVRSGKTFIMQTRGYGSHMGALTLAFDPATRTIASFSYDSVLLDPASWPSAPDIDSVVASWSRMVEEIAARPVGVSPREFLRKRGPDGLYHLGEQLCKAVSDVSGCPIVVFQAGGLRADLPAGNIVFKDIYQVLPFNHQILIGRISGKDLLSLIAKGTDHRDAELCIHGLHIDRVAGNLSAVFEGKSVVPDAEYPIALNDFLAKGGDGFDEFTRVRGLHPRGGIIRDALLERIRQGNLGK